MTSEIVIMNKNGIAVAADSAATLSEEKIFRDIKIFTLSKYHPIGLMIYGSSQFLGIPWETIVKIYRNKLKTNNFPRLFDFFDDLINFLKNPQETIYNNQFSEFQKQFFIEFFDFMRIIFDSLIDEIERRVELKISKKSSITHKEIEEICTDVIKEQEEHINLLEFHAILTKKDVYIIKRLYKKEIDIFIKEVFQNLPISRNKNKLRLIIVNVYIKWYLQELNHTGLVIFGFGKDEIFPSCKDLSIEGIINDELKLKEGIERSISLSEPAAIVPFAQKDMIYSFMTGILPNFRDFITEFYIASHGIYKIELQKYMQFSGKKEKQFLSASKSIKSNLLAFYNDVMKAFVGQNVEDIYNVVEHLPKEELAQMAEALISLTSIKQRVTMVAETVSGPIDVAIISKGDGLVWIKRKYYFPPELNPQFRELYYFGDAELDKE